MFAVSAYGVIGGERWVTPPSAPLDISCGVPSIVPRRLPLRGDIDCDGVVTIGDTLLLLQVNVGLAEIPVCGG